MPESLQSVSEWHMDWDTRRGSRKMIMKMNHELFNILMKLKN